MYHANITVTMMVEKLIKIKIEIRINVNASAKIIIYVKKIIIGILN